MRILACRKKKYEISTLNPNKTWLKACKEFKSVMTKLLDRSYIMSLFSLQLSLRMSFSSTSPYTFLSSLLVLWKYHFTFPHKIKRLLFHPFPNFWNKYFLDWFYVPLAIYRIPCEESQSQSIVILYTFH